MGQTRLQLRCPGDCSGSPRLSIRPLFTGHCFQVLNLDDPLGVGNELSRYISYAIRHIMPWPKGSSPIQRSSAGSLAS